MADQRADIDAAMLAAFAALAGDVHVRVATDGRVVSSQPVVLRVGEAVAEGFLTEDHGLVASLLGSEAVGPLLVRLRTAGQSHRWVSAAALPVEDGWWLQLRDGRRLDPTLARAYGEATARTADRDQVLQEVAWLLSATPRTGREIAIVSCCLDGFDGIAKEHGVAQAEEILAAVTARISDTLRSGDLVSRLDGDEFLIILRGVHHLRGAIRVANKIRVAVEDPIQTGFGEHIQTTSVGVTLISGGEGIDEVLERAEGAMRGVQQAGGNAVQSNPPI